MTFVNKLQEKDKLASELESKVKALEEETEAMKQKTEENDAELQVTCCYGNGMRHEYVAR